MNNYLLTLSLKYSFGIQERAKLFNHLANIEKRMNCMNCQIQKYQFALEKNIRNPLLEINKTLASIDTSRLEPDKAHTQVRSQIQELNATIEVKNSKIVELEKTAEELQSNLTSCQLKITSLEAEVNQILGESKNLKSSNETCQSSLGRYSLLYLNLQIYYNLI